MPISTNHVPGVTGLFIPFHVPSSKNSRRIVRNPSTGKMLVIHSKSAVKYKKVTGIIWKTDKASFHKMLEGLSKPYAVHFKFYRGNRSKFDYINPLQTVQDQMTEYGWIDDDNADEIFPVLEKYVYDKLNPGILIFVNKNFSFNTN